MPPWSTWQGESRWPRSSPSTTTTSRPTASRAGAASASSPTAAGSPGCLRQQPEGPLHHGPIARRDGSRDLHLARPVTGEAGHEQAAERALAPGTAYRSLLEHAEIGLRGGGEEPHRLDPTVRPCRGIAAEREPRRQAERDRLGLPCTHQEGTLAGLGLLLAPHRGIDQADGAAEAEVEQVEVERRRMAVGDPEGDLLPRPEDRLAGRGATPLDPARAVAAQDRELDLAAQRAARIGQLHGGPEAGALVQVLQQQVHDRGLGRG